MGIAVVIGAGTWGLLVGPDTVPHGDASGARGILHCNRPGT